MRLPRGWSLTFQRPVIVHRPNPRNWLCKRCGKWMRVEQMTENGQCPRCAGPVRRQI